MKTCPSCNEEENDDDERFCIKCGFVFFKSDVGNMEETSNQETDESKTENEIDVITTTIAFTLGKLIFPDKSSVTIDDSQRLVGRADLKTFTNEDHALISRSHFTIYKKDEKYFIKDGITNVQNKASVNNTSVNNEKLTENERELENGDIILVSDIEMSFEV